MLPLADENERALRDEAGTGEGYLYRYRDLVGERAAWVRQIIVEAELYFASPASFNDPFDCKARFRGDIPPEEFEAKANALMRDRGMSRRERRKALRSAPAPVDLAVRVATGLQREVDLVGVLSLSSSHENILMWSHYAFGHRGVCLQFRVSTDPDFLAGALPVAYSAELAIPTLFGRDHWERVEALLLTKAADWSYEREWRVLDPHAGPGLRRFPANLLTGLILGSNMSASDRHAVIDWVRSSKSPLEIYQAERHPDRYALQFEKIG